ncbi:MAG TPA: hypothetical protein VMV92_26835 [Streptosporangiaceae bacterium]|nr:hypothetical protein [Streptosporangiaceae bacterium]
MWGKRDDCIQALLAAEHSAPQEIHTRPAIRDMIRDCSSPAGPARNSGD